MKKTNKVNPLTHFNNTKTAAYKKASKEMANYKKSLPKAQKGIVAGPQTEMQSILSNQPPIPRPNRPSMKDLFKIPGQSESYRPNMNVGIANAAGQRAAGQRAAAQKVLYDAAIFDKNNAANANYNNFKNTYNNSKNTKGVGAGKVMEFTPAQLRAMGIEKRNGGPVKRKKK